MALRSASPELEHADNALATTTSDNVIAASVVIFILISFFLPGGHLDTPIATGADGTCWFSLSCGGGSDRSGADCSRGLLRYPMTTFEPATMKIACELEPEVPNPALQ
jgi:hypothetical protein